MSTKEPFLGRWSRRKREEGEADRDAVASGDGEMAPTDEADEAAPADQQTPDDLPDIDSLDKDSDFAVFMKEGVPEALRNRALRKLWLSDPLLANLDGLNDYDEDYGAILRAGAAQMRRLADAGERMSRPAALNDPSEETDAEDIVDGDPEETDADDIVDGDPEETETEDIVDGDPEEDAGDPAAPEDEKFQGSA